MDGKFNIEVGCKIKSARKSKKMSMKRLGELVHLHESTISRYEKGEIMALDIDKLKEFAIALDVPPTFLLGFEEAKKIEQLTIEEFANEHDLKIEELGNVFSVFEMWHVEIGEFDFKEDEMHELIEYAKFLKMKRMMKNGEVHNAIESK